MPVDVAAGDLPSTTDGPPMKNILLVEDEEMLVSILASVLEDEGYKVCKSTSAEDALVAMPDFRPDLIISDVKLPATDGFTMMQKIKSDVSAPKVPFICLTALDDRATELAAIRLGAVGYMTKPFDVDDLVKLVRTVLP